MSVENEELNVPSDISSQEFIDSLVQEFSPPPTAETPVSEPQAEIKAEPEPPRSEDTPPNEAGAVKEQLTSPFLAEATRREREARAKIEAFERDKEQVEQRIREQMLSELTSNPSKFFEKYSVENAGDIAMHGYAYELGDEAPESLRQQIGLTDKERFEERMEKRFREFEQRQLEAANNAKAQETINQYKGFISDVPADYKYLSAEAKHDPEEVLRSMAEVADFIYDTEGRFPHSGEVAKILEQQIASTVERYTQLMAATKPAQPEPTVSNVEKPNDSFTLSNDLSGSSPKVAPTGEDEIFEDVLGYLKDHMPPQ